MKLVSVVLLQLVALEDSKLDGAIAILPQNAFNLEPEWEIDPLELKLGDKLGACCTLNPDPQSHTSLKLSIDFFHVKFERKLGAART